MSEGEGGGTRHWEDGRGLTGKRKQRWTKGRYEKRKSTLRGMMRRSKEKGFVVVQPYKPFNTRLEMGGGVGSRGDRARSLQRPSPSPIPSSSFPRPAPSLTHNFSPPFRSLTSSSSLRSVLFMHGILSLCSILIFHFSSFVCSRCPLVCFALSSPHASSVSSFTASTSSCHPLVPQLPRLPPRVFPSFPRPRWPGACASWRAISDRHAADAARGRA